MNLKIITIASLIATSTMATCQTEMNINQTDNQGRKQGHWIKKYQNENVMYDGFFKNDHPIGEFRRYNEDKTLNSLLIYSVDGTVVIATIYHPNGNISSKGTYINQMKEGEWKFFSSIIKGNIISEEHYKRNLKNGPSLKFYPDSTVAEKLNYINDIRQGEWIRYYPNGSICLKSNYLNGKVNGTFEVWFENGRIEFSGQYKNDTRDGFWRIYKDDGTIKYELVYVAGVTDNRQMDNDESDYLDSLENNKGKISDPEKTGAIW
jgi:antitoxin component YwqK of YwqJK toxin-antitoxin module